MKIIIIISACLIIPVVAASGFCAGIAASFCALPIALWLPRSWLVLGAVVAAQALPIYMGVALAWNCRKSGVGFALAVAFTAGALAYVAALTWAVMAPPAL